MCTMKIYGKAATKDLAALVTNSNTPNYNQVDIHGPSASITAVRDITNINVRLFVPLLKH